MDEEKCVGAIVCKLDLHKKMVRRGYIAMLAVDENYRRRGIGKCETFPWANFSYDNGIAFVQKEIKKRDVFSFYVSDLHPIYFERRIFLIFFKQKNLYCELSTSL